MTGLSLVLFAILHSAGGAHGDRAKIVAPVVYAESRASNVDALLIVAIIEKESNFRARLVSPDGKDVGLMGVRTDGAGIGHTVEELKDPATNVRLGVRYFEARRRGCRSLVGALSDYNAGPRNRCHVTEYGRTVLGRYRRLRRLITKEGTPTS